MKTKYLPPNGSKPVRATVDFLSKLHIAFGWYSYLATQAFVLIIQGFSLLSWRFGVSAGLSFLTYATANQVIVQRGFFGRLVALGTSCTFHFILLTGYVARGIWWEAIVLHIIFFTIFSCFLKKQPVARTRNEQGAKLYDFATTLVKFSAPEGEPQVFFGGINIPVTMLSYNTFILGMSGTGKSICHYLLMQVFLYGGSKGIVYDPTRNQRSKLLGMGVEATRIIKTNPFDRDGYGWVISRDFTGRSACKELGKLLIPVPPNYQGKSHFPKKAGEIVGTVAYNLYRLTKGRGEEAFFTLFDLVQACSSQEQVWDILARFPDTKKSFAYLQKDSETNDNYFSTISEYMGEYEVTALLQHQAILAGRGFSIRDWLDSEDILLLGREETRGKAALAILNAALLTTVKRYILARPVPDITPRPYIFIFVDEFGSIGKIPGLDEFAREGRKHGVSLNLANQNTIEPEEKYGKGKWRAVVGEFRNWLFLTVDEPETQKAIVERIGKRRYEKRQESNSTGSSKSSGQYASSSSSNSINVVWIDKEEDLFLPSQIQGLSLINWQDNKPMGIIGKFGVKHHYQVDIYPTILKPLLLPEQDTANNYNPVPVDDEEQLGWTAADYQRLGLVSDVFATRGNFPMMAELVDSKQLTGFGFDDDKDDDDEDRDLFGAI